LAPEAFKARLLQVYREEGGGYAAKIEITYSGRRYELELHKIARLPMRVEAQLEGDRAVIDFFTAEGEGIGRCEIHKDHLEKGCLDCHCLILPPQA